MSMTHRELTAGVGRPEGFRRPPLVPESDCTGKIIDTRSVRDPDGHDVAISRCGLCGRTVVIDETANVMVNEYGHEEDIVAGLRAEIADRDALIGRQGADLARMAEELGRLRVQLDTSQARPRRKRKG